MTSYQRTDWELIRSSFISLVAHLVPKLFISLVGHLVPIVTSLCRAYVTTAAFCETRRILPWFLKPSNLYKLSVV